VVSSAIIEVGDALPLCKNCLRCELDVDREAVSTGALPPGCCEPARAHLVKSTGWLRGLVGHKKDNKRRIVVGLERLDDLFGHDGASKSSAGIGSDGVDVDVVLLALEGKRLGETEDTTLC
jgi:hypothetical protein